MKKKHSRKQNSDKIASPCLARIKIKWYWYFNW